MKRPQANGCRRVGLIAKILRFRLAKRQKKINSGYMAVVSKGRREQEVKGSFRKPMAAQSCLASRIFQFEVTSDSKRFNSFIYGCNEQTLEQAGSEGKHEASSSQWLQESA